MSIRCIVLTGGLVFVLLFSPQRTWACSCIGPPPPREALQRADAVFSGVVVDASEVEHLLQVEIKVDKVWKGTIGERAAIRTPIQSSACGYSFESAKSYLVYAFKHDGHLTTGLCSRTALLEHAQEDINAFDEPEPEGGVCGGPSNVVAMQILVFVMLGVGVSRWRIRVQ